MSSPGRPDKFPPPLMRFLRSNGGSRSRGRSRSSPMFVRKKHAAIETQEPSSPKVTCIGQVRVRRSKKKGKPGRPTKSRCWLIRKALFCHRKVRRKSFRPVWPKWVPAFGAGSRRKLESREDSSRIESNRENTEERNDTVSEDDEARVFVSSSSSPPKNALLLTRCRSAPYRSSSLASRFWGSPLTANEQTKEQPETEQVHREKHQQIEIEVKRNKSKNDAVSTDSSSESKTDQEIRGNSGFCEGFKGKLEGLILRNEDDTVSAVRPSILTRCKSEPARVAERLEPKVWLR